MKPLHVAILVVAGALAGAVVTQVWHRPRPAPTAAPHAAQAQPPSQPPQEPPPAVAVNEPPAVPPQRIDRAPRPAAKPQSVALAQSEPSPVVTPPAPVPDAPPPTTPPARTEPENVTPTPPPPTGPESIPPHKVTLNTGTLIPVRLVDGLSSERNMPGDTFTATLDKELVVDGLIIAERGARVEGRVVSADRGGKVQGVASLSVELTRIHTSDRQRVAIQTERFDRQSADTHREDATKVGAGAAVGAIIGAIAGGGKGAAIGAGLGGGAGAGDVLLTRGKPATLPSETRINFRLRAPVTIVENR